MSPLAPPPFQMRKHKSAITSARVILHQDLFSARDVLLNHLGAVHSPDIITSVRVCTLSVPFINPTMIAVLDYFNISRKRTDVFF
ncbi:hypothetical protein [Dickeya zeae]|uniref:Uncharacterized protein n=1 Tax=Dickeya zeae TaxID=204042 RepID=A0ABX8VUU6_9GAMM|nr:hypothetical protein [Dickeya zeae]MCO7262599.1 hypothetical protein [Dickeya zeae]QYM91679.1 hypothetical protein FGI21_07235 [Dickeya zeae]